MILTEQQLKSTSLDFAIIAKESVKAEQINNTLYGYGSELATLRLFAKFNSDGRAPSTRYRVGYSSNLETHYFAMDLS